MQLAGFGSLSLATHSDFFSLANAHVRMYHSTDGTFCTPLIIIIINTQWKQFKGGFFSSSLKHSSNSCICVGDACAHLKRSTDVVLLEFLFLSLYIAGVCVCAVHVVLRLLYCLYFAKFRSRTFNDHFVYWCRCVSMCDRNPVFFVEFYIFFSSHIFLFGCFGYFCDLRQLW